MLRQQPPRGTKNTECNSHPRSRAPPLGCPSPLPSIPVPPSPRRGAKRCKLVLETRQTPNRSLCKTRRRPDITRMEDDRAQVDLGIAAELEEIHISQNAVK